MTVVIERPAEAPDDAAPAPLEPQEQLASLAMTSVAAFLATAAAGWMAAGVFRTTTLARGYAVLAAAVGVGVVALSYRTRRPALLQWLAVPLAAFVAALAVLPFTTGGSASLPSLVAEAIRNGGISQPPVTFDPGWRFLLVLLVSTLGTASAALAIAQNRPKLAVLLPAPLLLGAALVQPSTGTLVSAGVAMALCVAGFGVVYGADLSRDGVSSGAFELRRLVRAGGLVVSLVAVMGLLSQAGFLFPEPRDQQVIPPRRPQTPPPISDRVLFTVTSNVPRAVPLHLGTLDVYRDVAWLTPPYDVSRLRTVGADGRLVAGTGQGEAPARPPLRAVDARVKVTITVKDIAGHVLPTLVNGVSLEGSDFAVQYDPRTQALILPDERARAGMTYTVEGPAPRGGPALSKAGPVPAALKEYLSVPAAPPGVQALLNKAPKGPLFERLQYLRSQYYRRVVAAGSGNPVDVPPTRVDELLSGKPGSPYEIAAGETLLARWAGVPARLGYGYYGGERSTGTYTVRPKDGAMWLEAYFDGWTPILGSPPRARASLSNDNKKSNPAVRPSDELALQVYVPVHLPSLELLYVEVRYWTVRALPWVFAALLAFAFYPGALKWWRRGRRQRWAEHRGPQAQIAVAYAELRDLSTDLNIGHTVLSPRELLDVVAPDAEHTELAWLVTRALWGDLSRDLQPDDVLAAREMSESVSRRLRRASPALNRVIAIGSRVSLRDPWSTEMPNAWPRLRARSRVRAAFRGLRPRLLTSAMRPASWVVVLAFLLTSCGGPSAEGTRTPPQLPARIAPAEGLNGVTFKREPSAEAAYRRAGDAALVSSGQVLTIHDGATVQGDLQVALLKPGLDAHHRDIRRGILKGLGNGSFEAVRSRDRLVYRQVQNQQVLYVWFPPSGQYFELLVARASFDGAQQLFFDLLDFQQGSRRSTAPPQNPPVDPRRTVRS